MDNISDAAEFFLRELATDFWCEMANREIGATGATYKYTSGDEARMAMLRLAYLRGREDEREPFDKRSFDADIARVQSANAER